MEVVGVELAVLLLEWVCVGGGKAHVFVCCLLFVVCCLLFVVCCCCCCFVRVRNALVHRGLGLCVPLLIGHGLEMYGGPLEAGPFVHPALWSSLCHVVFALVSVVLC